MTEPIADGVMVIVFGTAVAAFDWLMAQRRLPATPVSRRLVTLKLAGTSRGSRTSNLKVVERWMGRVGWDHFLSQRESRRVKYTGENSRLMLGRAKYTMIGFLKGDRSKGGKLARLSLRWHEIRQHLISTHRFHQIGLSPRTYTWRNPDSLRSSWCYRTRITKRKKSGKLLVGV